MDLSDCARLSSLLDESIELGVEERREWLATLDARQAQTAATLREMFKRHDEVLAERAAILTKDAHGLAAMGRR